MRKILISLMLCGMLMGCGNASDVETKGWIHIENATFRNKYYWSETKIVYITMFPKRMSPYISEKGKYCRYVDGRIEEVE